MGVVGWCDGPGLNSSAGASCNLDDSRARVYRACSRCGWGFFGQFYSLKVRVGLVWTFLLSTQFRNQINNENSKLDAI